MIKIGVVGAGHLGKIHLKLLNSSKRFQLMGFYDTDLKISKELSDKEGYKCFSNLDNMLDNVEAIDIVSPTSTHYNIAKQAILSNASQEQLGKIANKNNFRTMQEMGHELLLGGELSFEEYERQIQSAELTLSEYEEQEKV